MKVLSKKDIIEMMKQRFGDRASRLLAEAGIEEHDAPISPGILSPGLKVKHKQSKLLYTIDNFFDADTLILRNPEGQKFQIKKADLEKDYVLD